MNPPDVSIILPTQGTRPSLVRALRSALAQDFASFEIVVVDDSVDGSSWQLQPELAACLADKRVRLVLFNQGRGCAAAKNAGWLAARGKWLCYLDDDNEYRPGKIGAQHARAVASGCPLVLCGLEIHVGRRWRTKQTARDMFQGDERVLNVLPDTNVLFHRRNMQARWDEALGTVDDACLFQAIVAECRLVVVPNVPHALVIYHAHRGERANRDFLRHYRGQRRWFVKWTRSYTAKVRRILLLRMLVSCARFQTGGWLLLIGLGGRLLCIGGLREWRLLANTVGFRLLVVRRWMVS